MPAPKAKKNPLLLLCDPVTRACVPALREHWEKKYQKPHSGWAGWALAFDLLLLTLLGGLTVFWIFSADFLPAGAPTRVEFKVEAPAGAGSGDEVAITVPYANRSASVAAGAELRLTLPVDAVVTGVTPAATEEGRTIRFALDDLDPGASGTAVVQALLYGDLGQAETILGQLSYWEAGRGQPTVSADRRFVMIEKAADEASAATGLTVSASVTEPTEAETLKPGQAVTVTVRYQHRGSRPVHDVRLRLKAPESLIEAAAPAGLLWTKATTPALAEIEPDAAGEVMAMFTIRPDIGPAELAEAWGAVLSLTATADYFYGADRTRLLRTASRPLAIPLKTSLGVEAAAFYYGPDGDQLGRGPLPPRVGQTTKYWVFLHVTNTIGPVRGALLEAALPEGVEWTGRTSVSAGQTLDYLPITRGLRWQIGEVPAFADGAGLRVGASFEVALTPRTADVGQVMPLLSEIRVGGFDAGAGANVHAAAEDVTTSLEFDARATGKGKIAR